MPLPKFRSDQPSGSGEKVFEKGLTDRHTHTQTDTQTTVDPIS